MGQISGKQPLTRGQKYAEAKIVRVERGQTTCIEIKDVEIFDVAISVIADYCAKASCACTELILKNNGFTTQAFSKFSPCLMENKSLKTFRYIENAIRAVGGVKEAGKKPSALEAAVQAGSVEAAQGAAQSGLLQVLTQDTSQQLGRAIRVNTTLEHLWLEENSLADEGCVVLAEALQANTCIRELHLVRNRISDTGCIRLAEALAKNRTCASVDLSENQITDAGMLALLAKIRGTAVTELNLRANELTVTASAELCEELEANTSLLELNLRRNRLQDAGCSMVAKALVRNVALQRLHLSSNRIGDTGCSRLAESLKNNGTLQELYLDINSIEDLGTIKLAEALEKNTGLHKVDLKMNTIGEEGYRRLEAAVARNGSLRSFELSESTVAAKQSVEKIRAKLNMNDVAFVNGGNNQQAVPSMAAAA